MNALENNLNYEISNIPNVYVGWNEYNILVGVLAFAGSGAFYYFKVYKAKPKAPKQSLYDEDEEEYEEETNRF